MVIDPRSFDLQEDSPLWKKLLQLAHDKYPALYEVLYVLRCDGTNLAPSKRFGYGLQPVIDPEGWCGWTSKERYQTEAKFLLDPHRDKFASLIRELKS